MFEILKILHLLALLFGACASFGNIYLMLAKGPHDLPAPQFMKKLQGLFRLTALGAITTIFVTGFALVWARYGFWVDGTAFNVKLAFATILLAIVVFLNLLAFTNKAPQKGPPGYVRYLHMLGAFCLVSATLFAVVAFN